MADGHYVNPFAVGGWSVSRTDMGVDYMPIGRQSVVAIGAAKILGSSSHSGWPGGGFLWYRLLNGDHAGADRLRRRAPEGPGARPG